MPTKNSLLGGYSVDAAHGSDIQQIECAPPPCNLLGIKIAKSAIAFENAVAEYLACQCKVIDKLLCEDKAEEVIPTLRCFKENLDQVCSIETQLIEKLEKGLSISNCDDEEE